MYCNIKILMFFCLLITRGQQSNDLGTSPPDRETLHLLSLLPYPHTMSLRTDASGYPSFKEAPALRTAALLAVELINNRTDILTGYHLELVTGGSGCGVSPGTVDESFIQEVFYTENQLIAGIVGPACSEDTLLVSSWIAQPEISLISVNVAGSLALADKEMFPNSFSTVDSSEVLIKAMVALMNQNDWTNVAAIYDSSSEFFTSLYVQFESEIKSLRKQVTGVPLYDELSIIPFDAFESLRIFFVLSAPEHISQIFCLAVRYNISSAYYPRLQYVIVGETLEGIAVPVTVRINQTNLSCTAQEMERVVEEAIIVHYHLEPSDSQEATDSGLSHDDFLLLLTQRANLSRTSFYAAAYFDAVWSMALALDSSMDEMSLSEYQHGRPLNTSIIREKLLGLRFEGVSGDIDFNSSTGFTSRIVDFYQVRNGISALVEYYNVSLGRITRYGDEALVHIPDRYVIFVHASLPLGIIYLLLTVFAVIILAVLQVLSIFYASYRSIKASSPRITHMAYVGCYLIAVGVVLVVVGHSFGVSGEHKCNLQHAYSCLQFIGYVMVFATLFTRAFRIFRIFVYYLNPGKFIADGYLIGFIIMAVCIAILVIIIGSVTFDVPLQRQVPISEVEVWIECVNSRDYAIWGGCLIVYSWLFAIAACVLAGLSIKKVTMKDFKTSFILVLCYLLFFEAAVTTILYASVNNRTLSAINDILSAYTIANILTLYLCIALLFYPPVHPLLLEQYNSHLAPHLPVCINEKQRIKLKNCFNKFKAIKKEEELKESTSKTKTPVINQAVVTADIIATDVKTAEHVPRGRGESSGDVVSTTRVVIEIVEESVSSVVTPTPPPPQGHVT